MRLLFLVLLAATTSACFVPKQTGVLMQADLDQLRRELREAQKNLDRQQAVLEEQIERAEDQSRMIGEKIGELNRATRKTGADAFVQLEELRRLVQELTGQQELLDYELTKLQATAATNAPAPGSEVPETKNDMLAHGKKLLAKGKIGDARGVLRQVLKKWPREAGVSDHAHFQLGESYFKEKKYASALQEYIKVVEGFSKGKLVDDAYYRIGVCSIQLGNLEEAKVFFQEIAKKYPKSPMAKPAKSKLREVNAKLAKER